jgi:hypothetical protein
VKGVNDMKGEEEGKGSEVCRGKRRGPGKI